MWTTFIPDRYKLTQGKNKPGKSDMHAFELLTDIAEKLRQIVNHLLWSTYYWPYILPAKSPLIGFSFCQIVF